MFLRRPPNQLTHIRVLYPSKADICSILSLTTKCLQPVYKRAYHYVLACRYLNVEGATSLLVLTSVDNFVFKNIETCQGSNSRSNISFIYSHIEYDTPYAPSTTRIDVHTLIYNVYIVMHVIMEANTQWIMYVVFIHNELCTLYSKTCLNRFLGKPECCSNRFSWPVPNSSLYKSIYEFLDTPIFVYSGYRPHYLVPCLCI
jgi:hypothetical protein